MIITDNSWTNFLVLPKIKKWYDLRPGNVFPMLVNNYIYTPKKIWKQKKINHGYIRWHECFSCMSPDLRSVYSCIPNNTNNFIVITMYLSITLYEKILQLESKSFFTWYAVMNKISFGMSLWHFQWHCPDLKILHFTVTQGSLIHSLR